MTIENPSADENRRERVLEAMTQRIKEAIHRMVLEMPRDTDLDTQKQEVLSYMEERMGSLFPENHGAVVTVIESLRSTRYSNEEEMASLMANRFRSFLTTVISPEDLETKLRNDAAERSGWKTFNEALSYELGPNNEVNLHVPMIFTKKPLEMYRLFNDGLRLLATRLETDPELKGVEQIVAYSWIIFEHPGLIEKMGFTLDERDEKKKGSLAFMNRDDFIERYGN